MSQAHTTAAHVAHHFDDAEQQIGAATLGMWAFLATEVLFFGGIFAGYSVYRYWYHDAFLAGSHHLDMWLGLTNTAVLLVSSLMMALAVHAAQTDNAKSTIRYLAITMALGTVFLGIKSYEYYQKFADHLVPGASFVWPQHESSAVAPGSTSGADAIQGAIPNHVQLFYSFYFALTGLHAIHMIIGIGILGVMLVLARKHKFSADYYTPVEISGLYWHFVDIVWVFLFPLLYLIR